MRFESIWWLSISPAMRKTAMVETAAVRAVVAVDASLPRKSR
jgi:hypothetical protein